MNRVKLVDVDAHRCIIHCAIGRNGERVLSFVASQCNAMQAVSHRSHEYITGIFNRIFVRNCNTGPAQVSSWDGSVCSLSMIIVRFLLVVFCCCWCCWSSLMLLKDQEVIGGLYFLVTYRSLLFIAHAPIFHMQFFFLCFLFVLLSFSNLHYMLLLLLILCVMVVIGFIQFALQ